MSSLGMDPSSLQLNGLYLDVARNINIQNTQLLEIHRSQTARIERLESVVQQLTGDMNSKISLLDRRIEVLSATIATTVAACDRKFQEIHIFCTLMKAEIRAYSERLDQLEQAYLKEQQFAASFLHDR